MDTNRLAGTFGWVSRKLLCKLNLTISRTLPHPTPGPAHPSNDLLCFDVYASKWGAHPSPLLPLATEPPSVVSTIAVHVPFLGPFSLTPTPSSVFCFLIATDTVLWNMYSSVRASFAILPGPRSFL